MTPSSELTILCHLAARIPSTAAEIGTSCRMTAVEVHSHLVMLDLMGLVSGRQDRADGESIRVYAVTGEGRRKAGISDARGSSGVTP